MVKNTHVPNVSSKDFKNVENLTKEKENLNTISNNNNKNITNLNNSLLSQMSNNLNITCTPNRSLMKNNECDLNRNLVTPNYIPQSFSSITNSKNSVSVLNSVNIPDKLNTNNTNLNNIGNSSLINRSNLQNNPTGNFNNLNQNKLNNFNNYSSMNKEDKKPLINNTQGDQTLFSDINKKNENLIINQSSFGPKIIGKETGEFGNYTYHQQEKVNYGQKKKEENKNFEGGYFIDEGKFENKIKNIVKNTTEEEMMKMKQFIHEEISGLHFDLIRQFEIQNVN